MTQLFKYPGRQLPDLSQARQIANNLLQSSQYMALDGNETFRQTALLGEWQGRKIVVVHQMIPWHSAEGQWVDVSSWATIALDAQTLEEIPEYTQREVPNA